MIPLLIFAVGVVLLVAGAWRYDPALGMVVGGLIVIGIAWAWDRGGESV